LFQLHCRTSGGGGMHVFVRTLAPGWEETRPRRAPLRRC
jgi:DNA primase